MDYRLGDNEEVVATFMLDCGLYSINKYYYNRPGKKKIRTQEARQWAHSVFKSMNSKYNQDQVCRFKQKFDSTQHALGVVITNYYPDAKFYTKKDRGISSRTKDLTNVEKTIVDLIFDPKYGEREMPEGCPNLGLNDKLIVDLNSFKRPYDEESETTIINIYLKPKDDLK